MRQSGRLLKAHAVDHSTIAADRGLIARIADDLRQHGGPYTPLANWLLLDSEQRSSDGIDAALPAAFTDDAIADRMDTSDKLLQVWIGSTDPALGDAAERYRPFLTSHDPLGLWTHNVEDHDVAAGLFDADLGSILDLNLLSAYTSTRDCARVLEVGGGYGRTAEAALNIFAGSVKWVLVDAVPASLVYARDYLRLACPDARIGFYYDGDAFDLEQWDCYIVPSWHFEAANTARYDACVNIESFQEMSQAAVDAYLQLFESVAADDGVMYLSNAHDYVFLGDWNYPPTWRRLLCSNTPRSWTRDHPTEVFQRAPGDHRSVNAAVLAAYRYRLEQLEPSTTAALARLTARRVARAVRHRIRVR